MTGLPSVHRLKTVQPYYDAVASGMKSFDIRRADRPFRVGDHLMLEEYAGLAYTGRTEHRVITYVMDDPQYVKPGTVVLGIRDVALGDWPLDQLEVSDPVAPEHAPQPESLLKILTDAVGHFTDTCCLTGGCFCPPAEVYPLIGMEPREPCGGARCSCGAEDTARKLLPVVGALVAKASGTQLPEHLRGDGPCSNCGTLNNIIWFTDDVFWNAVVRMEPRLTDDAEILCVHCFVIMADQRDYYCTWRLTPQFRWETKTEAAARREGEDGTASALMDRCPAYAKDRQTERVYRCGLPVGHLPASDEHPHQTDDNILFQVRGA